ncbi:unnamed protein product [Zymoseptoria tritici ST99CH_3D1]|nr:unnamed protein product [Zymoseptoria tritici ST99CH_3D1]
MCGILQAPPSNPTSSPPQPIPTIAPRPCSPQNWSIPCHHFPVVDKLLAVYTHRPKDDIPFRIVDDTFFKPLASTDFTPAYQLLGLEDDSLLYTDLVHLVEHTFTAFKPFHQLLMHPPKLRSVIPLPAPELSAFVQCSTTKSRFWQWALCQPSYALAWTVGLVRSWTAGIDEHIPKWSPDRAEDWLRNHVQPAQRRLANVLAGIAPILNADPDLLTHRSVEMLLTHLRYIELRLILDSATLSVYHADLYAYSNFLNHLRHRSLSEVISRVSIAGDLLSTQSETSFLYWLATTWCTRINNHFHIFNRHLSPSVRRLAVRRYQLATWDHCAPDLHPRRCPSSPDTTIADNNHCIPVITTTTTTDDCIPDTDPFRTQWYTTDSWMPQPAEMIQKTDLLYFPGVLDPAHFTWAERNERASSSSSTTTGKLAGPAFPAEWAGQQCVEFRGPEKSKGGRFVGFGMEDVVLSAAAQDANGDEEGNTGEVEEESIVDEEQREWEADRTIIWCDDFDREKERGIGWTWSARGGGEGSGGGGGGGGMNQGSLGTHWGER